ncbi:MULTISPECIES: ABC transporter ATP-binding protein [unclassified Pseudofrankia]|uniref:ABC transporter ATP-binding protein n=1 Tax=unclassified Pseudofrankia TaxID=2994372 RepID=UPI0008DA513B|nr:ABC transporter ATP-binding protein [Pseudofrankia sp. BMG5.36]MDT3438211.1 ABC transporter ATP-binding protein [Pseudofrankia sp. BMG5.37]OHV46714.1 ABC transporter ATP-binding protein [Pseudofrankia sp. BMG5.36]
MVFRGGVHAVDQVSLDVAPGELVSIVGPSGCGKSTLLRIASGLQAPTHGSVTAPDDHIAYVFQDPTLLPWRNVLDNVALCSQLRREPKSERLRKAQAAIDMVGLTGFEKRYPNQLSGGMRMRTSLARALTLDPRLFLFDEPFGAIDEITRERLNGELLRIFSGSRFAGLFVTHSIAEAVFLSSRVVVMSARPGRIIGEFAVPFPYPRTPRLRAEAEFAALTGQIGECLRGGAE